MSEFCMITNNINAKINSYYLINAFAFKRYYKKSEIRVLKNNKFLNCWSTGFKGASNRFFYILKAI